MLYQHKKLGASFELPDDLTNAQLEAWEGYVQTFFAKAGDKLTQSQATRAAVEAAIVAGFVKSGDRTPGSLDAIGTTSGKVLAWMSDTISKLVVECKTLVPDPN